MKKYVNFTVYTLHRKSDSRRKRGKFGRLFWRSRGVFDRPQRASQGTDVDVWICDQRDRQPRSLLLRIFKTSTSVKFEEDDVAILDYVISTLLSVLACRL